MKFNWVKKSKLDRNVTFDLIGGLGNQLFCYFAAVGYMERTNLNVSLDIRLRNNFGTHREIDILNFVLNQNVNFTSEKIPFLKIIYSMSRSSDLIARAVERWFRIKILKETGYENIALVKPEISRFHGYFQSEKYFENVDSEKLKLFSPSNWFNVMSERAEEVRPIMIHVRRGDYQNLADTVGLLDASYFRNSVMTLCTTNETPIWVFSDDLQSVSDEFDFLSGYKTEWVKQDNRSNPAEILSLLTLGSGLVCSNSTFSWWAAYWSSPNCQVVVPDKWFKSLPDPKDLYLANWLRVKSEWK